MINLFKSLKAMLFFTLLLGVVYPFLIMAVGDIFAKNKAQGSQVYYEGKLVGSELIGQVMPTNLFQTRPSASDYNPLVTGGSNYAVNNKIQLEKVTQRIKKLQGKYGSDPVPEDLVFASGSGVDPDISVQAAMYQSEYIAKANNLSTDQVEALVQKNTKNHLFGIDLVNVLRLNLDLKQLINKAPKKSSSFI